MRCLALKCFLLFLFFFNIIPAFSQLGNITFDLQKDKPKKFENKVLKSEKTGEKKWTLKKRIGQNTVSHYNYYFNANNKLNQVIERARIANKDDYGKLLPFYGYSLNTTAAQKTELDSVIYKATAGILLHDLRSDWVDNLYLLIGKAYYFEKEFDSAGMTFQFINYNLFPRKRKGDDFPPVVGANENKAGNSVSIASNEDRSLLNKTFIRPPSRNDALVWQIRTLVETSEYTDAAGLINTLQNDQNFPSRLKADLEEVNAYWFYKQKMYDSAAAHLEKALSAAEDKEDKSRWEFLLAQLYEINKDPVKASLFYKRAMKHTTDPLLGIYANLNNAKIYKGNDPLEYNNTIDNLLKMAKRDKYESFRDIVFYSAGELALQKPDTAAAEFLFNKSISYNELNNAAYKNRAYLQLADIAFARMDYKKASAFYDSLDINDAVLIERVTEISERKNALAKIVEKIKVIEREDSLQHIAQMSEAERESYIKDVLKRLRIASGLKAEDFNSASPSSVFNNKQNQSIDLFSGNNTKGDWYFYNASVKAKGFSEFRSRWGNRQNVDNWRRSSSANGNFNNTAVNNPALEGTNSTAINTTLTYEGLLENVPLTQEKKDISNILLASSLYELGKLYQNNLEDYRMAVQTYESSLQRFPNNLYNGELYLNLMYCYQKLGDQAKAAYYKNLLVTKFNNSNSAQAVLNPQLAKQGSKDPAATKRYENIYNLFIEGQFEKALKDKKAADSLYGNNYWSPQLLYIQSVYHIKQKQDSQAIVVLNNIISQYPISLLKEKAVTMIDVLTRRRQIEGYLTNLQVTRLPEDAVTVFEDEPKPKVVTQPKIEEQKKPIQQEKKEVIPPTPVTVKPQPIVSGSFSFNADEPQNVIMILDKVDPVYISEARNAFNRYNREKFSGQAIEITKDAIDNDKNVLLFSKFPDANSAIIYADRLKKNAVTEVSWLPANKYSFLIISDANLQVLKANKDFTAYIKLLNTKYPGKF